MLISIATIAKSVVNFKINVFGVDCMTQDVLCQAEGSSATYTSSMIRSKPKKNHLFVSWDFNNLGQT